MRALVIATVLATLSACAPSSAEVKTAREARYTCEYTDVFNTVRDVVNDFQKPIAVADAEQGIITSQLRWHAKTGARKHAGAAYTTAGDVTFAVSVAIRKDDAGYFIAPTPVVYGHVPGSPRGDALNRDDADWPAWADTKVDNLMVDIYQALDRCAVSGAVASR